MSVPKKEAFFTNRLLAWHRENPRPMPWSETSDPYRIWLSEIILQQTRVAQGWAYYEKFVHRYPTIHDLAEASEAQVLKDWQGLGYNSRARNLHATAQFISRECNGKFPDTYADILALKGVGPYTASAIASFAYDLPYPVVDGNVKRIIARYYGIEKPVDTSQTHKLIESRAKALLGNRQPSIFNQAIMNFGALQCIPLNPDCTRCPVQTMCSALEKGKVHALPAKSPKKARKKRFFHYFVMQWDEGIILRKRVDKDIWQHMFDFPVLENKSRKRLSLKDRKDFLSFHQVWQATSDGAPVQYRQLLTHQHIHATFYAFRLPGKPDLCEPHLYLADRKNLSTFAFPKIIARYLNEQWGLK